MSELAEIVQQRLERIESLLAANDSRLWSTAEIAAYLNVEPDTARRKYICQPWFPKPILGERNGRRWEPQEVKRGIKMNGSKVS